MALRKWATQFCEVPALTDPRDLAAPAYTAIVTRPNAGSAQLADDLLRTWSQSDEETS